MGLSFVAIDFETANYFRGSPCAVGLVRVRNGEVEEQARWLMRPPEGCDHFEQMNIHIHGITPEMVEHEPRFAARRPDIFAFAQGLPFVAHNAAFDMGVLRSASAVSGLDFPEIRYACTLQFARAVYEDLFSFSLPFVAEAVGLETASHHDPGWDAYAVARIALDAAARRGASDLPGLVAACHGVMGEIHAGGSWSGVSRSLVAGAVTASGGADPANPFYGREVVFTGALWSMTRSRAWDLVAERGGQPAPGVTKRTNLLVIGFQDAAVLAPGTTMSGKARKAANLRAAGQPIEVLGEEDFLQWLDGVGAVEPPLARSPSASCS